MAPSEIICLVFCLRWVVGEHQPVQIALLSLGFSDPPGHGTLGRKPFGKLPCIRGSWETRPSLSLSASSSI